jgi:hypothetical protein
MKDPSLQDLPFDYLVTVFTHLFGATLLWWAIDGDS